jgi:hypothetical protein
MSSSLLEAAFAHHVWATLRVIDACLDLSTEEVKTSILGTRGPMLETLRHVVVGDEEYLFILTGDRAIDIDVENLSLAEARVVMERNGSGWAEFISGSLDADAIVRERGRPDRRVRTVGSCRIQARAGAPPRHRPSQSDLHSSHDARCGAAGDRCLELRARHAPDRREDAGRVALARESGTSTQVSTFGGGPRFL